MKSGKGQRSRQNREVNFEEAMNQAFSEIFQNLKVIKEDAKKKREKVDLQRRRRASVPVGTLREATTTSQQPKTELGRRMSTPTPDSTQLTTMHWVLQCFDEEEEDLENVGFLEDITNILS